MTEQEARTKWCPHMPASYPGMNCIASDCMMWRENRDIPRSTPYVTGDPIIDSAHDADMIRTGMNGYCGLAGKPE